MSDLIPGIRITRLQVFKEQEQTWFGLNALMEHWREDLGGVNEDGWVHHERYEEAVRKAKGLKEQLTATAEGDVEDIELLNRVVESGMAVSRYRGRFNRRDAVKYAICLRYLYKSDEGK